MVVRTVSACLCERSCIGLLAEVYVEKKEKD